MPRVGHDVKGFLDGELERRRALGYPPFRHLVRIVVSGPEQADALRVLEELKARLGGDELLGPAPLLRLRNRNRAPLVGKTAEAILEEVAAIVPKKPDLLEWRIDFFAAIGEAKAVVDTALAIRKASGGIPVLLTRRNVTEG